MIVGKRITVLVRPLVRTLLVVIGLASLLVLTDSPSTPAEQAAITIRTENRGPAELSSDDEDAPRAPGNPSSQLEQEEEDDSDQDDRLVAEHANLHPVLARALESWGGQPRTSRHSSDAPYLSHDTEPATPPPRG